MTENRSKQNDPEEYIDDELIRELEQMLQKEASFRGSRTDPQARARAEQLMKHADAICRSCPQLRRRFSRLDRSDEPDWSAELALPAFFSLMEDALKKQAAEMILLSDSVFCLREEGGFRLRFLVRDLWRE